MKEDQSIGEHVENAMAEDDQQEVDPEALNIVSTPGDDARPNLETLGKQASHGVDQPNEATYRTKDDTLPDLPPVPISVPVSSTHVTDLYVAASDHKNVTSTLPGAPNPLLVRAAITTTDLDVDPFPDLIESEFQDQHAPSWPVSQLSDGSYGSAQLYPSQSLTESEDNEIQAFAKLEFDDGEFYMNTYAVELGRDIQAARQAEERELAEGGADLRPKKRNASRGGSIRSDTVAKENGRNARDNVISQTEGVIADHQESEVRKKTRRKKTKSWSSSSRQFSRKSSMQFEAPKTDYNALAMASLMDLPPGLNGSETGRPMPSPDLTPLIPIHPPALVGGVTAGHKSISRKHVRIAFNFKEHLFHVEILGRNGGFVDEEWYAQGDSVPLVNGSIIQIGGVGIRFVLPDVPPGETGAEMGVGSDPLSGGLSSFDMANSSGQESPEEVEGNEEEDDFMNVKQEERAEHEKPRARGRGKKKTEAPPPAAPKRKGPGRPPKNGIISKREQALLARQAKEEAKAKAEGKSIAPSGHGKEVKGKDANEPKGEGSSLQPNGKRKYTKRKRAGGLEDQQAVRDSTEHTESVPPEQGDAATTTLPPKPAKEKKPVKPPRSPSPVFDESKMTPEQLAKPQSSYVVLIHEALTNSKTGQMSLPQIYRAIERRYPFYKLRVQTQGWQSSVRHNLSQHPAFRKIERDGKGWMWGLVPEVSIEKEKKRRATPPPVSQQHYYSSNPMMQHPYPYPGMSPPNGRMPTTPYGGYPGLPPGRMPYAPPPRPGFPLPLVNAQSESTYRSPYQSTPPAVSTPPISQPQNSSNTGSANGYYLTSVSQPPPQSSNNTQNPTETRNSPSSQAPPASASSPDHKHEQDVNQAVTKFKTALIDTMDDKARAETLVTSAINRVLGIQAKSSPPNDEEEDPNEKTIMGTFSKMLGDLSKQNNNTDVKTQGSSSSHPSSSPTVPNHSENPTVTALAAEKAANIALMNGESVPSLPVREEAAEAQEQLNDRTTKRPLEADDEISGNTNDTSQPEAKRVASATVET